MGFLSGAYGKLMAGKYLRTLQHKETMVQARLRRVTRQSADMEKYLSRMEKNVNANMQIQYQNQMIPYMQGLGMNGQLIDTSKMTQLQRDAMQQNMYAFSAYQMQMQQRMTQAQSVWAEQFDMIRESMLTPLKEEEDSIQTELDSLKSQIQLAQAEYDAKKEEEKQGAQNIKPDYTGQGG